MSKALEKISCLKQELKELQQKLKELKKMQEKLYKENCEIVIEQFSLEEELKKIKENKVSYQLKENEVKRKKIFTFTKTSIIFILLEYAAIALSLLIFSELQIIFLLIANLIIIPSSLKFGESDNYYSDRKILKEHNIDEMLETINNLEKKELLTKEKQDKKSEELSNLVCSISKIENQINLLIQQIDKLKNPKASESDSLLEKADESSKKDKLEEPKGELNSRKRKKIKNR